MTTNQTIDGVPLHWAEIEAAVRGAFQDGKKDYKGCMRERLRELRALLDAPAPCVHEWTDDGEFTLTCTKCGKTENHEPYGWVQTRGDAINHFTQEWDVVESWEERGFEYKAMFNRVEQAGAQHQGELVIDVQDAWEACGGNPGIKATKSELLAALRMMNEAEDEQPQGEPVAWMYKRKDQSEYGEPTRHIAFASSDLEECRTGKNVEGRVIFTPRDDYFDWKPLYAEQPAPVAVMMPERLDLPHRDEFESADQYAAAVGEAKKWNACLDELKRLNPTRPAHANPPPGTEPCGTHHDNDGLDDYRKPE